MENKGIYKMRDNKHKEYASSLERTGTISGCCLDSHVTLTSLAQNISHRKKK
jgi:hypothetical protein